MSWTTEGSANATSWGQVSENVCPPAWAQVSSIATDAGRGVNFDILLLDVYPGVICDDRPWPIVSAFTQGNP